MKQFVDLGENMIVAVDSITSVEPRNTGENIPKFRLWMEGGAYSMVINENQLNVLHAALFPKKKELKKFSLKEPMDAGGGEW